ncbi:MAG: RluA family pseudouridine synthase [Planctomycetota bacterium]
MATRKEQQEDRRPPPIEILFEDDHLIAAVKPAGLPTANAPAGRPSLFTWLEQRLSPRSGGKAFVGIVSRLDAPVSGVVVVAKSPAAAAGLAEQFRDRSVEKRYVAVVAGRFPGPLGQWVDWDDRLVRGEGKGASCIVPADPHGPHDPAAQDARTRARVVRRAGEVSLVELEPLTGRRHQLRAQLAGRGCPIVGDRLYGSRLPFPLPGGIALHAAGLTLHHPTGGDEITLASHVGPSWRAAFPSLFSPPATS